MGADPTIGDNENSQPIHLAAVSGSIPILDMLLEKNVDIETKDINQMTPMLFAVSRGQVEMTRHLVDLGANVNPDPCKNNKSCTCGPNFRTPLHNACDMGKLELIEDFVSNGAKVNLLCNQGFTPLYYAVKSGNIDSVNFLIDHGAFLNVKEKELGCTELHLAAAMGYGDIVRLLTEEGSCPKMTDISGKTPLDYAFNYGQNQIGYDLLASGANDSSLADYINGECLLSKSLDRGEATVWLLGHSGWAIKTQNHLLVFDYFDDTRARKPDHPCLVSGCIDTADLKNQHLTVFSTHEHADHFNQLIFSRNGL